MAATLSFKVYLVNENFAIQEVRRFASDRNAITNFVDLRARIQTIFPGLRGRNFSIGWKDTEEDLITISSNEELEIALNENNDIANVHKLYIKLHTENDEKTEDENQVVHVDITCDNCDKEIRGLRYKCVVCEDYDLCSICETLNLHREHLMMRMPQPLQWLSHSKSQFIRDVQTFVIKVKKNKQVARSKPRNRIGQHLVKKPTGTLRQTQSADEARSSNPISNQDNEAMPLTSPGNTRLFERQLIEDNINALIPPRRRQTTAYCRPGMLKYSLLRRRCVRR